MIFYIVNEINYDFKIAYSSIIILFQKNTVVILNSEYIQLCKKSKNGAVAKKDNFGIRVQVVFTTFKVKNYFSLKHTTPTPLLATVVYNFIV